MIKSLEYNQGNVQVKIDGHRHVLNPAKTLRGEEIPESDLSNELPLVKAVAEAVFPLSTRSEGVARFNQQTGLVKWNGNIITPESPLSSYPKDIKAFCTAVRTPETLATFESLKPEEDVKYEMENYDRAAIKMVNGSPVLVNETRKRRKTKRMRVKNEDGTLAFTRDDAGKKKPLYAEVPVFKN